MVVTSSPNVAYTRLQGKPSCAYSADIIIGGTSFELLVDTGSSNMAVASSTCTNCNVPTPGYSGQYDTTQPITVDYGKGDWSGYVATDYFEIQDSTNNSVINDFAFGVITQQTGFFNQGCNNNGIIGMAYASVDTDSLPIPIQSESMLNGMPYGFALYMCGNATSITGSIKSGHMWWGGYDSTYVSPGYEMKMVNVVHESYYVVLWTGVSVDNVPVAFSNPITSSTSIVDSGTTQILFSTQANTNAFLQAIMNSNVVIPKPTGVQAQKFWSGQESLAGYVVNRSVAITFQFASSNGTQNIILPLSNFFVIVDTNYLGFDSSLISTSTSNINILGIAFQEGQLVFFDRSNDKIGFALGNSEKCTKVGTSKGIDVFAGPYNSVSAIIASTLIVVCMAILQIFLL